MFARAILLCCLMSMPVHADTALPLLTDEQAAEFTSIGRLGRAGFRSRQSCSGTLVAPDIVLTAAHCLSGGTQTNRVFVAGWTRGSYVGYAEAREERRHPEFNAARGPAHDLGLIFLEEPIPQSPPVPLFSEQASGAPEGRFALVGYNQKVPHMLTGAFDCPLRARGRDLVRIGCTVWPGNSGGPLLARQDGVWSVYAVVSARINSEALAVPLDAWVHEQIAAHLATVSQ